MSARRLLAAVIAAAVVLGAPGSPADAQEVIDVDGTADFRNPPVLPPGMYRDTIVTGESVWYAVVYTNGTPYRFEVSLGDAPVETTDEIELGVSWIGPTLGSLDGPSPIVENPAGASYSGDETNIWYLEVTLQTDGRLGVEYDFTLDVEGVEDAGLKSCDELPECTLDEELAELDAELASLRAQIDAVESEGDPGSALDAEVAALEDEISSLDTQVNQTQDETAAAEQRTSIAQADIAELCAPDTTCTELPDPGSSTPLWATVLGGVVLALGLIAAGMAIRRRTA